MSRWRAVAPRPRPGSRPSSWSPRRSAWWRDPGQVADGVVGVGVPVRGGAALGRGRRGARAAGAALRPGLDQAGQVVVAEALHVGRAGGWRVGLGGDVAGVVVAVVQVIDGALGGAG